MLGIGAAMAGMRMFVHYGTAVFAYEAWNQFVNEAANIHYMSGGKLKAPVTFNLFHGIRGGGAPQHSGSPHAMYANNPGLEIVLPASPRDAKGLIRSAIASRQPDDRDPAPVAARAWWKRCRPRISAFRWGRPMSSGRART